MIGFLFFEDWSSLGRDSGTLLRRHAVSEIWQQIQNTHRKKPIFLTPALFFIL